MVPDLGKLPHATDRDHWDHWIRFGKAKTLMPAFAQSDGGPLDEAQIKSLVDYLLQRYPSHPMAVSQSRQPAAPASSTAAPSAGPKPPGP
jgi:mono/diheme cytochrome c family protein